MSQVTILHAQIIQDLEAAGRQSAYRADANEPDPRYKSYGVRAAGKKQLIATHRKAIRALDQTAQIELAHRLIASKFGEQQSVGLFILEPFAAYFSPDKFEELDGLIRCLHGWSKVDSFTGSLLRDVLFQHPEACMALVRTWNQDADMWLRRTSVVLFTRKVAKSGQFTDFGLEMCENLVDAPEDLVQKGVGWALKDMMYADKPRLLNYVRELRQRGAPNVITSYALRNLTKQERADFLAGS